MRSAVLAAVLVSFAMLPMSRLALAQPNFGERPPEFISPEVLDENKVAFRIHAPNAQEVRLVGGDIPHECNHSDAPHRLHVCVLKKHTIASIHEELSRRADVQGAAASRFTGALAATR